MRSKSEDPEAIHVLTHPLIVIALKKTDSTRPQTSLYEVLLPKDHFKPWWGIVEVTLSPQTPEQTELKFFVTRKSLDGNSQRVRIIVSPQKRKTSFYLRFVEDFLSLQIESNLPRAPSENEDDPVFQSIKISRALKPWVGFHYLAKRVRARMRSNQFRGFISNGVSALRRGKRAFFEWIKYESSVEYERIFDTYSEWVKQFGQITQPDQEQMNSAFKEWAAHPSLSILVAVTEENLKKIKPTLESVENQVYPFWELTLIVDSALNAATQERLRTLTKKDPRIKLLLENPSRNVSKTFNYGLAEASGEFVTFLESGDLLSTNALFEVANEIQVNSSFDWLYSDEDNIDRRSVRHSPNFKCDWNLDLFYSYEYTGHLSVFRKSIVEKLGGFREGFDKCPTYDLALRLLGATDHKGIKHLPRILYHRMAERDSKPMGYPSDVETLQQKQLALQEHLDRSGIRGRVRKGIELSMRVDYALPEKFPLVSLIICTRDKAALVKQAVDGVLNQTDYAPLEIIIVNNGSVEPASHQYFRQVEKDPRVKVIDYNHPFNFSALNNFGASYAKGEVLVLLNNDIKICSPDWLLEMVSLCLQKDVGAVGAKLYFENDYIQHAGVLLGVGYAAGHAHRGHYRLNSGYMERANLRQAYSAVTAACLVLRKEVFDEVGGLNEKALAVSYNDVDLCLKIGEKGYRNVWTPFAELYHLESVSRGSDSTLERLPRFSRELEYLITRWADVVNRDPFYNPNLAIWSEKFDLAFPPRISRSWKEKLGDKAA